MNRSQRIHLDVNSENVDKHVKVKLEQNVDTLEFLTMSIDTKDVYQDFNADYGVLVGRVNANDGVGIPNARISVFIPLADDDANDGDVVSLYPYKTPRDKNNQGRRYNLLPRVSKKDPITGVISPKQPFGSFPIKEEVVTNENFLNVYKKYYKYTALTNSTGDYMIFGIPTGTQTIHLSVDITDIGKYSMTPASMVKNLGYSANLFTEDGSKIKESSDLNDLPNIETQEITVDVIPFWGDTENFTIGITRQDFRIRSTLSNTFVIFGSVFTDADKAIWSNNQDPDRDKIWTLYEMSNEDGNTSQENTGIFRKRIGSITERIYYYPASVTQAEIDDGSGVAKMRLLDPSEYSIYKKNGDFVLILSCNRDKIIINEDGTQTHVDESFAGGLYTTFKGFMTLEITEDSLPMNFTLHGDHVYYKPLRERFKFPQHAIGGHSFRKLPSETLTFPSSGPNPDFPIAIQDNLNWMKEYFTFSGGGIYSISRFHGLVANSHEETADSFDANHFSVKDIINKAFDTETRLNVGVIQTNNFGYSGNTLFQMCSNSCTNSGQREVFGANWLNLSVYLPQIGWAYDNYSFIHDWRTNTQFSYSNKTTFYTQDNSQTIAGIYTNTCGFARSDLNWTDFICVPKEDIIEMNNISSKGFKDTDFNNAIQGVYRNGTYVKAGWCAPAPLNGGRICGDCTNATKDPRTYFFKGIDTSDCVAFITCLGIV